MVCELLITCPVPRQCHIYIRKPLMLRWQATWIPSSGQKKTSRCCWCQWVLADTRSSCMPGTAPSSRGQLGCLHSHYPLPGNSSQNFLLSSPGTCNFWYGHVTLYQDQEGQTPLLLRLREMDEWQWPKSSIFCTFMLGVLMVGSMKACLLHVGPPCIATERLVLNAFLGIRRMFFL